MKLLCPICKKNILKGDPRYYLWTITDSIVLDKNKDVKIKCYDCQEEFHMPIEAILLMKISADNDEILEKLGNIYRFQEKI